MIALRLSVMMFVQFFVWGAWYVTAPLFLSKIGFGGTEIGWTYSVGPIAGMISPFFVGMIADRFFSTERVLGVLHLVGAAVMLLATQVMQSDSPSALLINSLLFGHMLCYFPTLALTNSLALHNMTDAEKQFPLIRVFGTIGWIVAGVIVGRQNWNDGIELFYLAAGAAIVMGLYCFTLPHTPPASAGKQATSREILGLDALVLLKKPSFFTFMLCSFLICIPLAFYYQMAAKFVDHTGQTQVALKMSFGQMSEILFMVVMPLFFARLGVKWMLLAGMLAWVLRYGLFSAASTTGVPWMVLGGIVLHGICYDFFFVTGQIYTDKVAPSAIRSQAQGMLVLFTLGLGMFIGAQVAGQVEEAFTPEESAELAAQAEGFTGQIEGLHGQIDEIYGLTGKSTLQYWVSWLTASIDDEGQERVRELKSQIADLRQQRNELLLKSVHWKQIWLIPCVGAALIMVLFALVFRETPDDTVQEEAAAAA